MEILGLVVQNRLGRVEFLRDPADDGDDVDATRPVADTEEFGSNSPVNMFIISSPYCCCDRLDVNKDFLVLIGIVDQIQVFMSMA